MDFSTKRRFPQTPPRLPFHRIRLRCPPPAPRARTERLTGRAQTGGSNKISVIAGLALQSAILAMTTLPADIVFNHPARANSAGGRAGA